MVTATSRANMAYQKRQREAGKLKRVAVEFGKADMELYEFLKAQGPAATYIKNLIRKDMMQR